MGFLVNGVFESTGKRRQPKRQNVEKKRGVFDFFSPQHLTLYNIHSERADAVLFVASILLY